MATTALLVIDFQNDYFPGGKWALQTSEAAAGQGARLLAAFRDKGMTVIHVRHEFPTNKAPFFVPGSEGAQHHASVAPHEGEAVVLKHHANSFRDTHLQGLLDERGIEALVIIGAMSHMCIDASTRAAADLGYTCTVVHDACAASRLAFGSLDVSAEQVHAAFMAALGFAYARVTDTDTLLDELGQY